MGQITSCGAFTGCIKKASRARNALCGLAVAEYPNARQRFGPAVSYLLRPNGPLRAGVSRFTVRTRGNTIHKPGQTLAKAPLSSWRGAVTERLVGALAALLVMALVGSSYAAPGESL